MAQDQLAIIGPNVKDTSPYCKDTLQIHVLKNNHCNEKPFLHYSSEFSLIDDARIRCKPRMIYHSVAYFFEIEFTTSVPTAYQYEISLYYFDKLSKLRFSNILNAENIRNCHNTFRLRCKGVFVKNVVGEYDNIFNGKIILCSKICRKDSLYVLQQKPALLHSSQITDCSLLFENTALSNLTISVKDREFRVHKEILAAKSPVFLERFQTEMKEKQENHVKIEDIEANIFQEFLRYVYTNTVNDLNTHAEELYAAADKYDLPKLKSICIDELSRSLNSENAIHMFLFSDENNVTILKDRTMEFIKKHMNLIFQTEGYKSLCQSPKAYFIQEIFQATFDYLNALIYS
ncbi:speckle-type POZ protein-like isoform X1 [Belonocnema kinseyi]|uniref:speckle-type POZ protein-like isoform X1 n=1 Tax=Belonocnema kinseyi TaxID=2817044 RepID=UPI00143DC3A6|nr:speckle-type POZ protein-like isoform X1 [Belonocnema kinseyi]